jgi:hypothetical protein
MNCAAVTFVSIASLNVITTGAVQETPVAILVGTTETIVGWACAQSELLNQPANSKNRPRPAPGKEGG